MISEDHIDFDESAGDVPFEEERTKSEETPTTVEDDKSREEHLAKLAELKAKFFESLVSRPVAYPPAHQEEDNEGSTELLTRREKKYFDDAQFLKHLRARQWNLEKSLDMIRETLRWRREARPYLITAKEIEGHFKSGKNYHNGFTKQGRPLVIMRTRLDVPGDNAGKIKTILYQMERSLAMIDERKERLGLNQGLQKQPLTETPPEDQVAWIFDCHKFARKDVDFPLSKELARVLDHYPERLGVVYLVETHTIFRAFWRIARSFIDEKTRNKVEFVNGKSQSEVAKFHKHIEPETLEKCFGGTNEYVYNHEQYMASLFEYDRLREENNPFKVSQQTDKKDKKDKKKKKKKTEGAE